MWDLQTLRKINQKHTDDNKDKTPLRLDEKTELKMDLTIPFIGNRCSEIDEEKERLETLFVDISGWGREGEPALTKKQMLQKLSQLIQEHSVVYIAGEELGQFQGFVAVWK